MTIIVPKDLSNAYKPKVETPDEMGHSMFQELYETAQNHIKDILAQPRVFGPRVTLPEYSNIIAFTGDRGTGKTSAMLSMAGMLKAGVQLSGKGWDGVEFECLPMIDPSRLTAGETVLDVVLSHLYTEFDRSCRELCCAMGEVSIEEKRKVYTALEEVYQAVRAMHQSPGERHDQLDSLEGLRYLAGGTDLRDRMQKLLRAYLEVRGKTGAGAFGQEKRRCLVIPVDDVDLNLSQGYAICEELRKYFNLPDVVILFSLSMEQMTDIVRQEYLKDLGRLWQEREALGFSGSIPEMAAKYLEKLIPFSRRCIMPNFDVRQVGAVMVRYEGKAEEKPLVDELMELIEKKTGVVLIRSTNGSHAFLPTTLRGVMHLVTTLTNMPARDGSSSQWNKNLVTLQQYIQEYDFKELPQDMAMILQILVDAPNETMNQQVAQIMCCYIPDHVADDGDEAILRNISSEDAPPENISVGDVLFVLHRYCAARGRLDGDSERFQAVFRVLYTIRELMARHREGLPDELPAILGRLIYAPGENRLHPDKHWYEDMEIETIEAYAADQKLDMEAVIDTLSIYTLYTGLLQQKRRTSNQKGWGWRQFRTEIEPKREKVGHKGWQKVYTLRNEDRLGWEQLLTNAEEREYKEMGAGDITTWDTLAGMDGNRTRYFTICLLSCFTNCLQDDVQIKSEEFREIYKTWKREYRTLLPVESIDFIDEFIHGLDKVMSTPLKSGKLLQEALKEGAIKLTLDLLRRSSMPLHTRQIRLKALVEFPFWNSPIDYLAGFVDFKRQSITESKPIYQTIFVANPAAERAALKSQELMHEKLKRAKEKFEGVHTIEELKHVQGVSRSGGALLETHKNYLEGVNLEISKIRSRVYKMQGVPNAPVKETIAEIVHIIDLALAGEPFQLELADSHG